MPAPILISGTAHGYTLFLGDTTGAQSLLVLAAAAGSTTITDNKGNNTALGTPIGSYTSATYARIFVYLVDAPGVGAGHEVYAAENTTQITAIALSIPGSDLDVGPNGAGSTAGLTSIQSGGVTPTQDGDFLIAITANGDPVSSSAIAGFTTLHDVAAGSGVNTGAYVAYKQLGAGTSGVLQNPTHSWTPSDTNVGAAIIAFKITAAAPVITGPLAGGGRTHSTLTQGRLAP